MVAWVAVFTRAVEAAAPTQQSERAHAVRELVIAFLIDVLIAVDLSVGERREGLIEAVRGVQI